MARRRTELDFPSISIEGALFPADFLGRIAHFEAAEQSESDYRVPKKLKLRDELGRYFRIAEGLWQDFQSVPVGKGRDARKLTVDSFLIPFFRQVLGFEDLTAVGAMKLDGRDFPIGHSAGSGRVPLVLASRDEDLDAPTERYGDEHRRRSPFILVQEYLNAGAAQWAMVSNGRVLRLLRDNPSLTRPAYIEFDLQRLFDERLYPDFAVLWLTCHASRFGAAGASPSDCALERWKGAAQQEGTRARERLRFGVADALRELGTGFLSVPGNNRLRAKIERGELTSEAFYQQLLRLIYRLLFLFTIEERGHIHPELASPESIELYHNGYSLAHLRELASRRRRFDRHLDLWQALVVTFGSLQKGEPALGLPPLGGLFRSSECPDLDSADLPNFALLQSIYRLAYFVEDGALVRVNYRDMGPEELGSIYEALLELVPQIDTASRPWRFLFVGDDSNAEGTAQGNARKLTGSYYTPDSLVDELIKSALEPVISDRLSTADDPERALLSIKVLDPACGSGHFLLAAARKIAEHLARIRASGSQPAREQYRVALRDAITHCIYGVDRNPLAIELARAALWLESFTPERPLGFVDHHLRCGDALIGILNPAVMEDGIPADAYKPHLGDEKTVAADLARTNAAARKALGRERERKRAMQELALYDPTEGSQLEAMPDESLAEIDEKREAFRKTRAATEVSRARQMADCFVAAFYIPKTREMEALVPTTEDYHRLLSDVPARPRVLEAAREYAERIRAFHWRLEFSGVFASGGFDVLLGNPPWERVKLSQEEFFAARRPEIAKARNAATRNALIAKLSETAPLLAQQWSAAMRESSTESRFLRSSGQYPYGGVGDINTYAVFADLFRQLIREDGAGALLVPNGLVTGFTYRAFLRQLLQSRTLASFYGFENEDKIFPDVHNETKFGLLTIMGRGRPVNRPWFTAHLRQAEQIQDPLRRYSLAAEQIEAINPNSLNVPAFRWTADADVAECIHKATSVLIRRHDDDRVDNPWKLRFRRMFDTANDSALFLEHSAIAPRIKERRGAAALLDDGSEVFPLYEGKMLWLFDHRYGTYQGQTQRQANKGVLPHVDDLRHDDPHFRIEPRYWVNASDVHEALAEDANREWVFAWRDVGPLERTLVGALCPKTAIGDLPVLTSSLGARQIAALIALLGSMVVDYDARQRSNRMKLYVVEQLAILSPDRLAEDCAWLESPPLDWLAQRAHELSYTSVELTPFAIELGNSNPPFRWDVERRLRLRAEIDAAVLHLYGLTRSQAVWIIDSFTVLRKYEEADLGEFRTRRAVLDVYDAMQDAIRTGKSYRTRLDPPPADMRCAHGMNSSAPRRAAR